MDFTVICVKNIGECKNNVNGRLHEAKSLALRNRKTPSEQMQR